MLSSLLHPFKGAAGSRDNQDIEQVPKQPAWQPIPDYSQHRHATADFTEADDDDEESNDGRRQGRFYGGDGQAEQDEDGSAQPVGVLPMFAAGHLGITSLVLIVFTELKQSF